MGKMLQSVLPRNRRGAAGDLLAVDAHQVAAVPPGKDIPPIGLDSAAAGHLPGTVLTMPTLHMESPQNDVAPITPQP